MFVGIDVELNFEERILKGALMDAITDANNSADRKDNKKCNCFIKADRGKLLKNIKLEIYFPEAIKKMRVKFLFTPSVKIGRLPHTK